jgi:AraC-like DNA-binding protein
MATTVHPASCSDGSVATVTRRKARFALFALSVGGFGIELAGVRFPVEPPERMEHLVEALVAQGVLLADPTIARALAGEDIGYSERNTQRVVSAAAGLGRKRVEQLRRARQAYALLRAGASLTDAAVQAGYSDQAHMTRSFGSMAGRSPAKILAEKVDPFVSRPVE